MWIYTDFGSIVNMDRMSDVNIRRDSEDGDTEDYYKVAIDSPHVSAIGLVVQRVSFAAAQETLEKLAWCIAHDVDLVRITRDGDVLDMLSYSNHGTARHTQRVFLKQ